MDQALEQALLMGVSLTDLFLHPPRHGMCKSVEFGEQVVRASIDTAHYEIQLDAHVPRNVAVIFGGNERKIVWSNQWKLLPDWHQQLHVMRQGIASVAIAYGDHLYQCDNLSGTFYVFSATVQNVPNTLVLINMNGWLGVQAIKIFKPRVRDPSVDLDCLPLTKQSPALAWNWQTMRGHPFVCERVRRDVTEDYLTPLAMTQREVSALQKQYDGGASHDIATSFDDESDNDDITVAANNHPNTVADDNPLEILANDNNNNNNTNNNNNSTNASRTFGTSSNDENTAVMINFTFVDTN